MRDLVGEWCAYHHNLHNINPGRRTMQLRVLRQLEAQLEGDVGQVDAGDLERYMTSMLAGGYHPHTVVRDVKLIRPFLRWMWQRGLMDAERWLRLAAVRPPRGAYDGSPRPYSHQEIRQFWIEFDRRYPWTADREERLRTPARGEYWVRRWAAGNSDWRRVYPYARRLQVEAIAALALYGGLRRDEIYRIALDDLDYEAEYVRVRSRKGADGSEKVRIVPMNQAIMLASGNWLEFRAQVLAPAHDRPWLCLWAPQGALKPMSHTQFGGLLTNVGRGWEMHRLRHTMATERYRAGMPIEILQQILGHATITQTQGYARIDTDRIIAAAKATDDTFLNAVQRDRPTQPKE